MYSTYHSRNKVPFQTENNIIVGIMCTYTPCMSLLEKKLTFQTENSLRVGIQCTYTTYIVKYKYRVMLPTNQCTFKAFGIPCRYTTYIIQYKYRVNCPYTLATSVRTKKL